MSAPRGPVAVAWPAFVVAASIGACSGSTESPLRCGAGTRLAASECVAIDADASPPDASPSDAPPSDAAAAMDSSIAPQGGDAAAGLDATEEGAVPPRDAADDRLAGDAGDADLAPDPCPDISGGFLEVTADCDPACSSEPWDGALSDRGDCQAATCSGMSTISACSVCSGAQQWVVRTPNAPATDARCALDCPSQPWAYGLSLTFAPSLGGQGYAVTVSPPWYLISGTSSPFCQSAGAPAPAGCLWFDGSSNESVYVVTADPQAPARNVVSQPAGSCP